MRWNALKLFNWLQLGMLDFTWINLLMSFCIILYQLQNLAVLLGPVLVQCRSFRSPWSKRHSKRHSLWFVEFQEFLEICAISGVKMCEACPPAPKIAELDTKTDPRLSCSLCWWARRSGCLERSGREATRLSSICPWELPESAQHIGKAEGILRFFLFRGLLNAVPLEPRLGLPEKIFVRPSCTDYTHRWVQ